MNPATSFPTREEYIADKIRAAMTKLLTFSVCPECGQVANDNVIGSRQDFMDVITVFCHHPFHTIEWIDGDPNLLVIGLPNHPNFDSGWVKRMQESAYHYAIREKL